MIPSDLPAHLADAVASVRRSAVDSAAERAGAAALARWANRAKPPGSLGRLEDVAVRMAAISATCPPAVPEHPAIVVFAGDHGVVADGASAWPSEVTAAMVATMAAGGAAINAFARTVGATVTVVDVGVASDLTGVPEISHANVRRGTDSIARGPAMSRADAVAALAVGAQAAQRAIEGGADLLVAGDMGIGNTTPSAALIAWAAAADPEATVGPGAGSSPDQIANKVAIVSDAVHRFGAGGDGIDALASLGGLEIAAIAGFQIAGAAAGVPVIVDGVISLAALCAAEVVAPGIATRVIAGHRSTEPGATIALRHLDLEPVLDLDLRLGEGTGACLAIPLVQAAARALQDMAELPS